MRGFPFQYLSFLSDCLTVLFLGRFLTDRYTAVENTNAVILFHQIRKSQLWIMKIFWKHKLKQETNHSVLNWWKLVLGNYCLTLFHDSLFHFNFNGLSLMSVSRPDRVPHPFAFQFRYIFRMNDSYSLFIHLHEQRFIGFSFAFPFHYFKKEKEDSFCFSPTLRVKSVECVKQEEADLKMLWRFPGESEGTGQLCSSSC